MLYGINPFLDRDAPLLPVMTFNAPVIAVRAVSAGETVGYGSTWVADRPTKLAVIAAGYADGYPREAPSGTPVAINGHLAHIAGRISMDMMTVALPDEVNVEVGDWAELWGRLCRLRILVTGAIPLPTPLCVVSAVGSIASIRGRPRNEKAKDRLCVWRLRRRSCQVARSVSVLW